MKENKPDTGKKAKKPTNPPEILRAIGRRKLYNKYLKIVTYNLENGEIAMTLRQAEVAVKNPPVKVKNFLRETGENPRKVKMQNRCVTNMIPLSAVAQYWQHLNQRKKGNLMTEFGEELLADYLPKTDGDSR
ncbi:hypothetical protein H6S82_08335 [Planktothrix sp. FACHB-1355]|uniref:Uncharacterized protein n=1 Tax=Aerosakkonema funiforme FACHB-1375 TaxID=2949571 RepID=A0A926ZIY4_9CYAN|nr:MULTISPECIES: hypothetical protein [Oscillatoriales]MBD2184565.1 hypothetical protein [Aerosakkonema funiforme FACHB-1375]MBD3558864.1 hypothetical protein [Planktothrix sp. FACHB-1355]